MSFPEATFIVSTQGGRKGEAGKKSLDKNSLRPWEGGREKVWQLELLLRILNRRDREEMGLLVVPVLVQSNLLK